MSLVRASWMSFVTVFCVAAGPGTGTTMVEDFEGPDGLGGFTDNPVFIHDIQPSPLGEPAVFEFTDVLSASPSHALALTPGRDVVSFDLPPGQFVDFASVALFFVPPGETTFLVVGVGQGGALLEVILDRTDGLDIEEPFVVVSTENLGFAEITGVELRSTTTGALSSVFDDLTIRVVPEPTSLCLLAAGLFGLARSRRRLLKR